MKKYLGLFLAGIIILTGMGCGTKAGPIGPQGSTGASGPEGFEVSFQDGISPSASYAGTSNTWLDASNPLTSHSGPASLRVAVGALSANYGRVLIKFDLSSLPQNAKILTAALLLKTQTTTNLSSGVTYSIGVNDMDVPAMVSGGCTWTASLANWNFYGAGTWGTCVTTPGAGFFRGYNFVAAPMDTVTFTSAANGTSKVYGWNLTPSVVQAWISGPNDGLVIGSNSDSGEQTGNIDFYPNADSTATNRPQLIISYSIP